MKLSLIYHRRRLLLAVFCLALPVGLLFAMSGGRIIKQPTAPSLESESGRTRDKFRASAGDMIPAEPAQGGSYNIQRSVIAGGGTSANGNFVVNAAIGQSNSGVATGGSYSINSGFFGNASANSCAAIAISPTALPGGSVGAAYNQTVSASPSGNYSYSVTAGALPAGLSLNPATGAITGTPTVAATASFTITATASGACSGSQNYSITIQPAQVCPAVTGIAPTTVTIGGTVTISGSGFTNVSGVKFANNVTAQFTAVSDTQITATVPVAAVDGPVTISKAGCGDVQTAPLTIQQTTPRLVRVANASGAPGAQVMVPIELVSQGDENALGFSLTFDTAVLSNPQAVLGSDATGGQINSNFSQTAQGRFGLLISLGSGQSFSAGTRQIAVVTFTIVANASGMTAITFGNQPIPREISSATALVLPANYVGGAVTVAVGYEADVSPRPNGNNSVTVTDWVQIGRFVGGLDTPAPGGEFQRADCAPRSSLGNGALTVSDWVQAGRYAGGLDPASPAGGPTSPTQLTGDEPSAFASVLSSSVRVESSQSNLLVGDKTRQTIKLLAQGGENALGFSLLFESSKWRLLSAELTDETAGANLIVNRQLETEGKLGFMFAYSPGKIFSPGEHRLFTVTFEPVTTAADYLFVGFGDSPTAREISDANANRLPSNFTADYSLAGVAACTHVSAASFAGDRLAAEQIVAAFGSDLATTTDSAATLPLRVSLGGATVTITDSKGVHRLAGLFFASPGQINYLLPSGLSEGISRVTITANGKSSVGLIDVAPTAPGLFTANSDGQGLAAAVLLRVRTDGSQSYEPVTRFDPALNRFVAAPVEFGEASEQLFLLLYGTGLRHHEGRRIKATVGGIETLVPFVGAVEGFAGLDQINLSLPRSLAGRGEIEIKLAIDGRSANVVNVVIMRAQRDSR